MWNLNVSYQKCKRARKIIREELDGSYVDEFAKLQAYCNELRVTDPGTEAYVNLSRDELENDRKVFKRMYVCFNAAKVCFYEILLFMLICL